MCGAAERSAQREYLFWGVAQLSGVEKIGLRRAVGAWGMDLGLVGIISFPIFHLSPQLPILEREAKRMKSEP